MNTSRPSLLLMAPVPLTEPFNGSALQIVQRAIYLGDAFEITVLSPTQDQGLPAALRGAIKQHVTMHRKRHGDILTWIRALRGSLSYHEARFSLSLEETDALLHRSFDVVYLNFLLSIPLWERLKRDLEWSLSVIDLHNDDAERFRQIAAKESNIARKLVAKTFAAMHRRRLRATCQAFDAVLCVSDEDKATISSYVIPGDAGKLIKVENGVEAAEFYGAANAEREPKILFLGSLDVRMNQVAVQFLIQEYWPAIRAKYPSLGLWIVGRNPPDSLIRQSQLTAGVELIANAPDVRPYYWRSLALIAPFVSGGGRKLKILEAMAAGTVVLASREAMQGISACPDVHYIEIQSPADALEAINTVLTCPDVVERLRRKALQLARQYDWAVTTRELQANILKLLEKKQAMQSGQSGD